MQIFDENVRRGERNNKEWNYVKIFKEEFAKSKVKNELETNNNTVKYARSES